MLMDGVRTVHDVSLFAAAIYTGIDHLASSCFPSTTIYYSPESLKVVCCLLLFAAWMCFVCITVSFSTKSSSISTVFLHATLSFGRFFHCLQTNKTPLTLTPHTSGLPHLVQICMLGKICPTGDFSNLLRVYGYDQKKF